MPRKSATPRKLPQQDRSKVTVEAILIATARILTSEGYDRATTNQIAVLAGVSIGSLYQYFPSKEALVTSLAENHANTMMEIIESKLKDLFNAPLEVVIRELVKASITAHCVDPMLHKVLNEQVPRINNTDAEHRVTALLRAYLELHHDRIEPQNLDLAVLILERTVEALTHTAVIERPKLLDDGQLEQEITTLLLSYLTHGH
jgi:AcrR family transcriptional regulator